MIMRLKKLLRRFGYDIVRYHPLYDILIAPISPKTVLDIGANTGAYARMVRKRFPEAVIHSFEPLSDCFETLEKALPGDARFHVHKMALGNENGESIIHRSSFNPSSSLRPMAALHKKLYPKSAEHLEETIDIARLDDVAETLSLEGPLLIKMDVQGFEDQVLRGGVETVKKASALIIETSFVSLYENQPLFDGIYQILRELGFEYRGRLETHYNRLTGEPIYEDAVFIRVAA